MNLNTNKSLVLNPGVNEGSLKSINIECYFDEPYLAHGTGVLADEEFSSKLMLVTAQHTLTGKHFFTNKHLCTMTSEPSRFVVFFPFQDGINLEYRNHESLYEAEVNDIYGADSQGFGLNLL